MNKITKKRWVDRSEKQTNIKEIENKAGINELVLHVLGNRGISTEKEAMDFLFPKTEKLHNPYLLNDMEKAVERILKAIENGETIYVYGDYDVDGVTSTSTVLTLLKEVHDKVDFYIPHREEGYGINKAALQKIKDEGADLVISVDCGITAMAEADFAKEIGLDLIITDHHEAGEIIPDCIAVINPMRKDNTYPFQNLAGVGVAYKLCVALQMELKCPKFSENLEELFDLVAFGSVADLMPLVDENRIFVQKGLALMNNKENLRVGMKAIIKAAGYEEKKINAGTIGFQLGPRINALGRLESVVPAVNMMMTEDFSEAMEIALHLNDCNTARQSIQEQMTKEAIAMIESDGSEKHSLFVGKEGWNSGIKGVVASKVLEEYYRPTAMFVFNGDKAEGSARSIEDFNIKDALDKCKDLLVKYGGHHGAAGMTVERAKFEEFTARFEEICRAELTEEDLIPKIRYDKEIELKDITFDIIEQLSFLEPFGQGNASPTFAIKGLTVIESRQIGEGGKHLKFKVKQGSHMLEAIAFGKGNLDSELKEQGVTVDMIATFSINDFRGNISIQLEPKDIVINKPFREEHAEELDELFKKAEEQLKTSNIVNADSFYTKVVGVSFEGRQEMVRKLETGQSVTLVRQPENMHDKNAIAVISSNGEQIGFLKAKLSKDLAPLMDNGIQYIAEITSINGNDETNMDTLGVNIFIEKLIKEKVEIKEEDFAPLRENYSQLDTKEMFEVIKEKLLGGYPLREKQVEAVSHLMNGDNTLSVLGTGRGKSAIFQSIAAYKALKENKMTIIIYPLRALANDQLSAMKEKFSPLGIRVEKGTGEIKKENRGELWDKIRSGNIDILLTTPEFLTINLMNFLEFEDKISFLVVDEGHHVGKSSTTYRPAYKDLSTVIERLDYPTVAVMTATCSDETFGSINEVIPIKKVVIDPTVRANLTIVDHREIKNKENYIADVIQYKDKSIIYVNSREKTVEIAKKLRQMLPFMKDEIAFYHAGLDSKQRHFVEKLFRKGAIRTIVSTSAFGEGIDIPDIRHVMHYHMTFNEVEFNQESGRAGRDGEKCYIHLLFGALDLKINDFILRKETPSIELLRAVYVWFLQATGKGEYEVAVDTDILARDMQAQFREDKIVDDTILVAMEIFREFGVMQYGDSAGLYYVRMNLPEGKLELENSLRHQEALHELEEFIEFSKWILESDGLSLLKSINKPIYPTKVISE